MAWIVKVGGPILKKKGENIYDYVNALVELDIPLDQLGLLILARTYHRHVAVFCKDYMWSTRSNNSPRDCTAYLVYKGGVEFIDSAPDYLFPEKHHPELYSNPIPYVKKSSVARKRKIEYLEDSDEPEEELVVRSSVSELGERLTRNSRNSRLQKPFKTLDKVLQERRQKLKEARKKKKVPSPNLNVVTFEQFVNEELNNRGDNYTNQEDFVSDVSHLLSNKEENDIERSVSNDLEGEFEQAESEINKVCVISNVISMGMEVPSTPDNNNENQVQSASQEKQGINSPPLTKQIHLKFCRTTKAIYKRATKQIRWKQLVRALKQIYWTVMYPPQTLLREIYRIIMFPPMTKQSHLKFLKLL